MNDGLRWLGAVPLCVFAWTALDHARDGTLSELLWICNVNAVLLGVGLVGRHAASVQVATVWLLVGLPLWIYDAAATQHWTGHSWATHVGLPVLGGYALRHLPPAPSTWWRGAALLATLQVVCRLATPPALNINLAFRPWAMQSGTDADYAAHWLAHMAAVTVALFAVEQALSFVLARWPARAT